MRRLLFIMAAGMLLGAGMVRGKEITLVNGFTIQGDVEEATAEGLSVATGTGSRVLPWETLSPAVRFRHDPVFREHFKDILEGAFVPSAHRQGTAAEAE